MKQQLEEEITSWNALIRYVERKTKDKTVSDSLKRLIKDSLYDQKNKRFIFTTVHGYATEPRLKELSRKTGVIWIKEEEEDSDRYFWDITRKLGEKMVTTIKKLKADDESRLEWLILKNLTEEANKREREKREWKSKLKYIS